MTTFYVPKQLSHQSIFTKRIEYNNSSNRLQQFNIMMSNEETKQLAGLVAKTRALFENTNKNNRLIEPTETPKIVYSNRTQKQLNVTNENDSDKENTKSQETVAPFLNQLKPTSKLASKFQNIFNNDQQKLLLPSINTAQNKNKWNMNQQYKPLSPPPLYSSSSSSASSSPPPSSLSCHSFESSNNNELVTCEVNIHMSQSPSSNLWQPSEETSKELNLPTSVRQAKMCFERNIQQQSSVRITPQSNRNKMTSTYVSSAVPLESPIFSSSSSSSPSIPSSPTSSVDSSSRFKSLTDSNTKEEKCVYPFNFNQKQLQPAINNVVLPHLTQSANNKIKILKKNFIKNSNTIVKEEMKPSQQSPKFLQLFQNQTDSLSSNAKVVDDDESLNQQPITLPASTTSTASIQIKTIKLKQQEPVVSIKSILRNKTSTMSDSPIATTQLSPKLNEKHVKNFLDKTTVQNETTTNNLVKVDQSSCVLPSKLKSKNLVTAVSDEAQRPVPKSNANTNTHFKTWQQKTDGQVGFIKNNSSPINNGSNNLVKRVNRNAATAKENLLRWCRKHTQSYYNVNIENFSSSWSNGLAFCALIHHFMPDSFDYNELDSINARRNFELAFQIAEDKAGIVSLLDVDDMIEMGNSPDWKCVFTYVHSIYQKFKETS